MKVLYFLLYILANIKSVRILFLKCCKNSAFPSSVQGNLIVLYANMASPDRQLRQVTAEDMLRSSGRLRIPVREEDWGGHKVRIASIEGHSRNPAPPIESSGLMHSGVKYSLRSEGLNT